MDYGVQAISDMLEEYKWVSKIEIPERISKEVLEQFQERLKANAPKKGKKGKKKKKKWSFLILHKFHFWKFEKVAKV